MSIEKQISSLAETKCANSNECSIDLSELSSLKWDEIYIFSNVSKIYIQEKIKIPYTVYKDVGVKAIFIFDGKIVQYGEFFPSLDTKDTKRKITFSFDGAKFGAKQILNYYRLVPDNAKLKVIKKTYSNDGISVITIYTIHPGNESQVAG